MRLRPPRCRRPRSRRRPRRGTTTHPPSPHRAPLEARGLSGPALDGLAAYLDALAEWSRRVNLTGAHTPAERVDLLVTPVLPARALPDPGTLLDIGSGNGSPGLVLALLRPDLDVTLLEPRTRRWAFLREAVRRAGGPAVRVLRGRHHDYPGTPVRTVTLRALALPLAEVAPLVEPGGRLVVFGGAPRLEGPFTREEAGDIHVFRRTPGSVPR